MEMEFVCVELPYFSDLDYAIKEAKLLKIPDNEVIWARDNATGNICYCFCQEIDSYGEPILRNSYNIHPAIIASRECYCEGDVIWLKGMPFVFLSSDTAIAMNPIGAFAIADDERFGAEDDGDYMYEGSCLQEAVQDWFNYFFKGKAVSPDEFFDKDIEKYYDIIPMMGHDGLRFQIVNKDNVVRYDARGHGFISPEKARNMLRGYASKQPIPMEDVIAYRNFKKDLEGSFKDYVPF